MDWTRFWGTVVYGLCLGAGTTLLVALPVCWVAYLRHCSYWTGFRDGAARAKPAESGKETK